MNRKAQVENISQFVKLIFTTTVGCCGVIVSILMGINCQSYYNISILPCFILALIPLVVHFQKQKNTSKMFYFMMWVTHFFCFVFQCDWDESYNGYYTTADFNCPTDKLPDDQTIKIGYGNYYLLMISVTFFHLLECVLLTRKIYELAASKKSI